MRILRPQGVQSPDVKKQPRNRVWHLVIPFLVAVGLLWVSWLWSVRSPRIIVSAVAPDGTELRVIQTCNLSFTTSVYYRKPGVVCLSHASRQECH